jgi:GT2 family glycosyltransferase
MDSKDAPAAGRRRAAPDVVDEDLPSVAAILVSHEGSRWLPKVLHSLANLDHMPNRWVGVDVVSDDTSRELLSEAFGDSSIVTLPAGTGFGDAIGEALKRIGHTDWIWLLHDDAIVSPEALSCLLVEAMSDPFTAVVGPKIREWPSLQRLLEVGVSITGTASRETGLEPGEPDHGQHDWPETVLAVSTAGMLVRRDVWDELGGLDPGLPLFFDDIDFGWRVSRAGYAVRYCPGAVLFHAEASRRGLRKRQVHAGERRAAAVYTVLANETGPRFWWQSIRLFLGTLLRMVGSLLVRDFIGARAEMAALGAVYLRPGRMRAARAWRRPLIRVPREDLSPLFPSPFMPYQHGFDVLGNTWQALVDPESIDTVGRRVSLLDDPDEELPDLPPLWRRYPWLVIVLGLVVAALIAGRGLFSDALSSPALPPAPDTVWQWWELIFARFHNVGIGSTQWAPAYIVPLAIVGLPFALWPGLVVMVLFIFAVPMAALTAHRFGRLISSRRLSRKVWAITWALAIVATGAVAQGRIGTVVVLILAPVVANAAMRLFVTPSWQLTFMFAMWTAVTLAFAPTMLLVLVVAIVVAALNMSWSMVRQHWIGLAIATVLVSPSLLSGLWRPARWWWEAGRPVPQSVSWFELLAGQGGALGMPMWWLSIPIIGLAVAALLPASSRASVLYCWIIAVTGLGISAIGPVLSSDWVGLGAGIWLVSLATAVLLAVPSAQGLAPRLRTVLLVAALIYPVAVGGWWLWRGDAEPLSAHADSAVPVYLNEQALTTAVLTGSWADGFAVSVEAGGGTTLGEEHMRPSRQREDDFGKDLQVVLANPNEASVRALAADGIEAIYLPQPDTRVEDALDSAPGLRSAGSDRPGSRVWIVSDELLAASPTRPHAWVMRPALAALWVLAWIVVAVLAMPVRRRDDAG